VPELSHRHVRKLEAILCWTGTRQVILLVYPLSVLDGMPHVDGNVVPQDPRSL